MHILILTMQHLLMIESQLQVFVLLWERILFHEEEADGGREIKH